MIEITASQVPKSVQISDMGFPAIADYESYFRKRGYLSPEANLLENDDLLLEMQRHWHAEGQNGCVFAQVIATKAEQIGWDRHVIRGLDEARDNSDIHQFLEESIGNDESQVLSFLFPEVRDVKRLVALTKYLADLPQMIYEEGRYEDLALIKLRAIIDTEGTESWALGFGPFEFFPNTRQAPITELVIRTKPKPHPMFHRLKQDGAAHIADIPLGLADKTMEYLWSATQERANLLRGDAPRDISSAKITYVIPLSDWQPSDQLGSAL